MKILTPAMDNVDASILGQISTSAGHDGRKDVGDNIDRGLILLRLLNTLGYQVARNDPPHSFQPAVLGMHTHEERQKILEVPISDTYWGRLALTVEYNDESRDYLIQRGWKPPEGEEPSHWIHTLHDDHGAIRRVICEKKEAVPFGRPGLDYGDHLKITIEPFYSEIKE